MSFALTRPPAVSPWVAFPLALAASFAVAGLDAWIAASEIASWYANLRKPVLAPPDWMVLAAWPLLHGVMALAAGRIATLPRGAPLQREALALFAVQLALSVVWSLLFFGRNNPEAGLLTSVLLLAAAAATTAAFWRLDRAAGRLMLPCLAWVGFVSMLNGTIVALN